MKIKISGLALFLLTISTICNAQMDLLWYNFPELQGTGNGFINNDNFFHLKNKDYLTGGENPGGDLFIYSYGGDSLQTNATSFMVRFDSTFHPKAIHRFNYDSGLGRIIEGVFDKNENFYGNLINMYGPWKFDSSSSISDTFPNNSSVIIALDSTMKYKNHVYLPNYINQEFLGLDFNDNPITRHLSYFQDTLFVTIYTKYFQQIKAQYLFVDPLLNLLMNYFNVTSAHDYYMIGKFRKSGIVDIDPTSSVYNISVSLNMYQNQDFLAIYDTAMHVKKIVQFNPNVECQVYYVGDHFYVYGNYNQTQLLIPTNLNTILDPGYNHYIACFDNELNLKWTKLFESQEGFPLFATRQSNPYISGAPMIFNEDNIRYPVTQNTFDFKMENYRGDVVFMIDSNGHGSILGVNKDGAHVAWSTVLDDHTIFGNCQFQPSDTENISFNEIPEIKIRTNPLNQSGYLYLYNFKASNNHFVEGKLIADLNYSQTLDSADAFIPYRPVINLIDSSYTLSDYSGIYALYVDSGQYSISSANNSNFNVANPLIYNGYLPDSIQSDTGKNFFYGPENIIYDLKVDLDASSRVRTLVPFNVYLSLTNIGTQTTDAYCKFNCGSNVWSYITSNVNPSFYSNDSIIWNFQDLKPFQTITITLTIQIDSLLNIGDSIFYHFYVDPLSHADDNYADNIANGFSLFSNSFDPNEKRSSQPSFVDVTKVDSSFEFKYEINFENTGNDTAFKVILVDTLDTKLNLLTLNDFQSNAKFTALLFKNNILKIEFDSIYLPDTSNDHLNSHGFFSFSIKPKLPISLNENILNRASIFFDYNEPVLTNYTSTQFINNVGIKEISSGLNFNLYPNPANDFVILEIDNKNLQYQFYISDQIGKRISALSNLKSNSNKISVSNLKSGMYFITLISSDGNKSTKRFVKY